MISAIMQTLLAIPMSAWLSVGVILFAIHLSRKKKDEELRKKIAAKGLKHMDEMSTPPKKPIIGHMYLLRDYQDNSWAGLDMIRSKWGDIVKLQMGQLTMVMVSSHELIRELLIEKGETFSNRPGFDRLEIVFGSRSHSLALCDYNEVHKDRRKMCQRGIIPTSFSSRNQLMGELTLKQTKTWTEKFDKDLSSKKEARITKNDVLFLTSDHFLEFLTGEKRDHSDKAYQQFNYGADFLFWEIQQSYLVDFFPSLKSIGLSRSQLKRLDNASKLLRDYVEEDVWTPRFKKISAQFENKEEIKTTDFIDTMILDHLNKTCLLSLNDYKLGFADLYGGHAAVSNMLIRALGHLALRPDVQEKVREEAARVNIDKLTQTPKLVFSEAVVQESLRIASSPIVPHVARSDGSLGGYYIPTGTTILVNNYHLNRSETLWDKPLEWNPSRFIDPTSGQLKLPPHFIPFSVGIRSCLGLKMVIDICTFACAYVCHKYHLSANDANLTTKLLQPRGMLGLNPDAECFEIILKAR